MALLSSATVFRQVPPPVPSICRHTKTLSEGTRSSILPFASVVALLSQNIRSIGPPCGLAQKMHLGLSCVENGAAEPRTGEMPYVGGRFCRVSETIAESSP